MFKPGHLHRQRAPGVTDVPDYVVDVYYEVQEEPGEGLLLCLTMQGVVDGRAFTEQVRLHRDTAFNFAAVLGRLPVVTACRVMPVRSCANMSSMMRCIATSASALAR